MTLLLLPTVKACLEGTIDKIIAVDEKGAKGVIESYSVEGYGITQDFWHPDGTMLAEHVERRKSLSLMPPEYVYKRARDFDWTVYLEDTAPQKRVANAFVTQFDDFRRQGRGLYIFSETKGSGKTLLAWSALSKAASTLVLNFLDTLIEFIHNIDWSKIVTNIQDALTNIQWIAIAEKILELLGYALGSITGALARLIGNLIAQGASEAYQYFEDKIKEAGGNVVDGILLGILDALLGIGSWIVDNVFKPILDGFKNAFGIHSPSTVMQEQGHYIIEGLLLGITDFLSKIKKKFEEIRNLVTEKMDNIKSSAVSKVNEMKKGLSDGVERIKESFRSGFSALVGYVKSPINSIIRFINNFLYAIQTMQNSFANALNSMSISLPHWLEKLTGFSSVGFNVGYWSAPMVPYLAQGAVIPPNKEFMAVLGDQKNGNNIEAPESLIRRIVREESGNNGTQRIEVPVYLNRREIARAVLEEGRCLRTVTGRNPFELI